MTYFSNTTKNNGTNVIDTISVNNNKIQLCNETEFNKCLSLNNNNPQLCLSIHPKCKLPTPN